jgi:hypothetical protein
MNYRTKSTGYLRDKGGGGPHKGRLFTFDGESYGEVWGVWEVWEVFLTF